MTCARPLRLILLVPSLEIGGAENRAVTLACALSARGHVVHLVTLYPGGPLAARLRDTRVALHCLHKRGRWDLRAIRGLLALVDATHPELVYTWLPQTNVWASFLKVLRPGVRLVWSVMDAGTGSSPLTAADRVLRRIEPMLAPLADLIIANSEAGLSRAIARGFPRGRMGIVQNGIDVARFEGPGHRRERVRAEWDVSGSFVIGIVARLDPIKDHATFLRAASVALGERNDLRFVVVGDGPEPYRAKLRALAEELHVAQKVTWAGVRNDIPDVLSAFDIATLTSVAEGFPNAVLEAMAAGVPCVATDVGDCARLVGTTGRIVPPGAPEALARAWLELAELLPSRRREMGAAARTRAMADYGIDAMTRRTEDSFLRLV